MTRPALLVLRLAYRLAAAITGALQRFQSWSRLPLPPAYAYVQHDALRNLHAYLGVDSLDIRRIVVVGAWHGEEVYEMLDRFPRCDILLLEPSREAFAELARRFDGQARVRCAQVAASSTDGTAVFHETNIAGNGSLLPLVPPSADAFTVPGIEEIETYEVRTVRLDAMSELQDGTPIDCLWVDVQGLELSVLHGAMGLLPEVRASFLEVATDKRSYEGATAFDDLEEWMAQQGFRLASLGTDPVNGQGNALWVKAGTHAHSASDGPPAERRMLSR